MKDDPWATTRTAYDTVAESYADQVRIDTAEATMDLAVLHDFAARVRGRGPVLDAGCGPGRMTHYLVERGVDARGIDLSPEMVRVARARHPGLAFDVGSIDALPIVTGSLAGVLSWYSVIHTPPAALPAVLAEFLRVLAPGGWLLTGCQSGVGTRHLARAYGHDIDLTGYLYTDGNVAGSIEQLGGVVHTRLWRGPERSETRSQAFVLARKPGAAGDAAGAGAAGGNEGAAGAAGRTP